ncbi:MAG: hypothetical protein ACI4JC_01165 [Faecalibacterium sp.]
MLKQSSPKGKDMESEKQLILQEAKLEIAYGILSEVHQGICNASWFGERGQALGEEITGETIQIMFKIIGLSKKMEEFYRENKPKHSP